jgi:putative CRISPR-associated protein (TIGR02619 family)
MGISFLSLGQGEQAMSERKFVLTTVGISVLLNALDRNEEVWRRRINQEANAPELSSDVQQKANELRQKALATLQQGDIKKIRELSAELNGLCGLYSNQLGQAKGDTHYLIATDTALGKIAAEVTKEFLQEQGMTVDVYVPTHLSSAEPQAFSEGIKNLMHWCEQVIPGYRNAAYQVIFNLTAAFKSLQGYLNIVGMFYADRIVYIFETGQLVSIPRLPIQIDVKALREHRMELALMAHGFICATEQVQGVPEGLLEIDEKGNTTLSDWGALIWNRVRSELLAEDLLPFPRLQYADSFRRDFKQAGVTERAELQEVLAKVAGLLESANGDTTLLKKDGGLQYDLYTNKKTKENRPIGHFRVSQSRRVSCTTENGTLHLRHYGEHHLNDNP